VGAAAGDAAGVAAKDLSAMASPASEASVSSSGGERLYDGGYVRTREGERRYTTGTDGGLWNLSSGVGARVKVGGSGVTGVITGVAQRHRVEVVHSDGQMLTASQSLLLAFDLHVPRARPHQRGRLSISQGCERTATQHISTISTSLSLSRRHEHHQPSRPIRRVPLRLRLPLHLAHILLAPRKLRRQLFHIPRQARYPL
jgi:hypothetical protein